MSESYKDSNWAEKGGGVANDQVGIVWNLDESEPLPKVTITQDGQKIIVELPDRTDAKRYKQALEKFAKIKGSVDKVECLVIIDWIVRTAKEALKDN